MELYTSVAQVSIPSCTDFSAVFGCECSSDDDTFMQECHFEDKLHRKLLLSFHPFETTFRLILQNKDLKELDFCSFNLQSVKLHEEQQAISIKLKNGEGEQEVYISIIPYISITFKDVF